MRTVKVKCTTAGCLIYGLSFNQVVRDLLKDTSPYTTKEENQWFNYSSKAQYTQNAQLLFFTKSFEIFSKILHHLQPKKKINGSTASLKHNILKSAAVAILNQVIRVLLKDISPYTTKEESQWFNCVSKA